MAVDTLYQELILDHSKHPRNAGLREPYDAETHHVNPTCGDEVTLRVRLGSDGSTVEDVSYDSLGCSISQASVSVMTDLVIGRSLGEATTIYDAFLALMRAKGDASSAAATVNGFIVEPGSKRSVTERLRVCLPVTAVRLFGL